MKKYTDFFLKKYEEIRGRNKKTKSLSSILFLHIHVIRLSFYLIATLKALLRQVKLFNNSNTKILYFFLIYIFCFVFSCILRLFSFTVFCLLIFNHCQSQILISRISIFLGIFLHRRIPMTYTVEKTISNKFFSPGKFSIDNLPFKIYCC